MNPVQREPFVQTSEPFVPSRVGRITAYIPEDVESEMRSFADRHGLSMRELADQCIGLFLVTGSREPRPYIPEGMAVPTTPLQLRISKAFKDALEQRASDEGRPVSTVFLRAVIDYLRFIESREVMV